MNFSLRKIKCSKICASRQRVRDANERERRGEPLPLGRGSEKNDGQFYFGRFQRRTDLSRLPERTRRPSGEKATLVTEAVWPWRRQTSWELATSQIRRVVSEPWVNWPSTISPPQPVRTRRPSGE